MNKNLIILRGLPGSGKSSFAKVIDGVICSADDYFIRNGEYIWSANLIGDAHAWCQRKCQRYMNIGVSKIVIDNTSTTEKELKPYMDLAKKHGYKVFSVIVENRHGGINTHNVPQDTLNRMKNRFEISL